jgi:hypothetical protein
LILLDDGADGCFHSAVVHWKYLSLWYHQTTNLYPQKVLKPKPQDYSTECWQSFKKTAGSSPKAPSIATN